MWNLYSYCQNNPITYMDPDGNEPNKSQVTTPKHLIKYLQTVKGANARERLAYVGTYETLGGAKPEKKRYIYTEKAGWIDLVHFFNVAKEIDASLINRIAASIDGKDQLWQKTAEIENGQAAVSKIGIGTAWSYEDAPSNYFGYIFWKDYYNPEGNLAVQMYQFLSDYGGSSPQNAPNWKNM